MTPISNSRKGGRTLSAIIAGAIALGAVLPAGQAAAGERGYGVQHGGRPAVIEHGKKRYYRDRHGKYRSNDGHLLAAGIIGFAIGAILSEASRPPEPRVVYVPQQPYPVPPPAYYEPYPRRPLSDYRDPGQYGRSGYDDYAGDDEPRVIRYEDEVAVTYEPWTPEWEDWCRDTYRSFNPRTGTFRGYDGLDHFCVVK